MITFDFGGCGISDGEYISLGWFEKEDLLAVINHIRKNHKLLTNIGVWGRSMGAVTVLLAATETDVSTFFIDHF